MKEQKVLFLEAALFCLVISLTSLGKSVRKKVHSEARTIYIFIETPGFKSHLLVMQVFHTVLQHSEAENIRLSNVL